MHIEVVGADEVLRRLDDFKKTKSKAMLRKGTRAGAKVMQEKLKAETPRLTGASAKYIKVRAYKRSRRFVGHVARFERVPESKLLYIFVVNYGSKKRKIAPREFIQKAVQESRVRAAKVAVDTIRGELDKV